MPILPNNPSLPLSMEDLAVEYIIAAAEEIGTYSDTDAQSAHITRLFYKAICRGMLAFIKDHMFVPFEDGLPVPVEQIPPGGGGTRTVLPYIFINQTQAWKNEI